MGIDEGKIFVRNKLERSFQKLSSERKEYYLAKYEQMWAKKKHKISLLPREGEVLVAKDYLFGVAPEAYICKECEKFVLITLLQRLNRFVI